jgi:serine phosphatase RsbU (regulator of sigma subunit)/Tfp pilus assembly protein PilF
MRRRILILLFILPGINLFSQDQKRIDSLQSVLDKTQIDTIKIGTLSELSEAYYNIDPEKSLQINKQVIELVDKALLKYSDTAKERLLLMKAASINNLGILALDRGEIMECLEYYKKSLPVFEQIGNKDFLAQAYNNIGFVYENQGDISRGMEYYFKSLKLREEIGDKRGIGESYNNIAYMYKAQGESKKSLETFLLALKYFEEAGDQTGIGLVYNNVGNIYKEQNQLKKSLEYLLKSVAIKKRLSDHKGLSSSYVNIGDLYEIQKMFDSAQVYYDAALTEGETAGNKSRISSAMENLASLSLATGKTDQALFYARQSLSLANELGFPERIRDSYLILSDIYFRKKDYKSAYTAYRSYKEMADSILSDVTKENSVKTQMKYSFDKRELEMEKEKEKSEIEHRAEMNKQKFIIYTAIGILLIVITFSISLYNRFRITRKQKLIIEKQKCIVEEQKQEVELQKELVEEKNKEITDSINYAKRIQQAILPPPRVVKEFLPDSFILYKPKDIVAGDFYWLESINDEVVFASADCTGHGVPGAMVSVVCHNALNRSVREFSLTDPAEILNKTRELVIETFQQSDHEVRDGMDISLCSFNPKTLKMKWSGANNPLWIIRNNELIEYKGDKQPIGKFEKSRPFTPHTIDLQKQDIFYILTDGYADQFGGDKGKKFKYKQLQETLLENSMLRSEEQKQKLDQIFESWKGTLEQVDDVCIIGVRIPL